MTRSETIPVEPAGGLSRGGSMHLFQFHQRRAWFVGVAVAALLAGAAQAQPSYAVRVGGAGLDAALLGLAAQTRQRIFFPSALVADLKAPAVAGDLTPEQALDQLLAGSGLRARRVNPQLLVVERITANLVTPAAAQAEHRPFGAEALSTEAQQEAGAGELASASASTVATAPVLVDEVRVTGSNIRGTRSASPLLVVDRAALERSGYATVAAALAALPQAFGGGASEGTLNTGADRLRRNTAYGSSINLRGLGSEATLVLINGRRLAGSGSFGDFADISSIPTAAVDRVEILLDGASATYGADAVGGVVNIILKKRFEGAETRIYAGLGTRGEPFQGQISQTLGRTWEGGGVLLAFEYQKRNALPGADRDFTATTDLRPLGGSDQRLTTSFPGNILRTDPATGVTGPGWAIPGGQNGVGLRPADLQAGVVNRQNQRQGADTLPRQSLQSVYLTAHQALGERLEISGDVRYAFRKYGVHLPPQTTTLTVNRANPFFVSPNGSASHSISYSFANDLPNPFQVGSAETWAATLGATYRLFGDWKSDSYLGAGQELNELRAGNAVNILFLNEALGTTADRADTAYSVGRDGYFNPFNGIAGANNPTALAFIGSGFSHTRVRVRSYVASSQADGTLFEMPGGPFKLALGGQVRRETLRRAGSNFAATAVPTPQESGYVHRRTLSAFAEVRAPIVGAENRRPGIERLEISLAGRLEDYDDVGTTTKPKLGVIWAPTQDITIRGTYGRSFRAPSLREVHDPAVNTQSTLPLRTGERIRVMLLQGGNPNLGPETATTWTLGFDVRPAAAPGLSLSATAFDVAFRNRIDRPVQQNTSAALFDPALASFVQRITPATNPADLALITALINSPAFNPALGVFPPEAYLAVVDNRAVNTTALNVRGVDVSAAYRFDLGDDQVALGVNATYIADFKQRITPTTGVVDRVARAGFPVRFRSRATADWTHGRLTTGVAFNYVDGYRDALGPKIGAQPTFDLQLRLAGPEQGFAKQTDLLLTVRNVFDRDPPFYNNTAGVAYDPTNADPIGRFAAIQLTRRW